MSGPFGSSHGQAQPGSTGPSHYQQQPQPQHAYPPPQQVPIFQVTTMRHTGALVFWFNQRHVITGTYAQCQTALRSAQIHNVALGWWSLLSILMMNWIAISSNLIARKKLNSDVQQAQAYAQWWYQYIGAGRT